MVKEASSFEMPENRKKLDYEVYPHMVEQLIEKIKEQQEITPWAREDFDELISGLKKLAKVSRLFEVQRPLVFIRQDWIILGNISSSRRI